MTCKRSNESGISELRADFVARVTRRGAPVAARVAAAQSYDTAVKLAKSELSVVTAFMTGKVKVAGNMGMLMGLQGALSQLPTRQAGTEPPQDRPGTAHDRPSRSGPSKNPGVPVTPTRPMVW